MEHPFWLAAPELRELVSGKVPGRATVEETTCFLNNLGIGLQFAAVGAAVYAAAKSRGAGHEIPTDWFLETVHPSRSKLITVRFRAKIHIAYDYRTVRTG
mgnify:CR=1 FL=1